MTAEQFEAVRAFATGQLALGGLPRVEVVASLPPGSIVFVSDAAAVQLGPADFVDLRRRADALARFEGTA